jgi:hypothetical protein
MTIDAYNKDWETYKKHIENKIKGRCSLTNKNWLKLRDFHFEQFIKTVPHPYGLIFKMIFMSKVHKNIPCIYKMYYKYKKERDLMFQDKAEAFRRYR